ncbi:class I SAM-dependent methyltransferase [Demequina sp.]|uniref:class I SAM-dependent methyltransferase n=1 Tax=Demequina sp. TaxID=2050685 RepID=UPI0025BE7084|nr:class I SAM-dependent methyltransferase [Demequina sp.]
MSDTKPRDVWEERYRASTVWTGKVNAHLTDWLGGPPQVRPGTAIDLGCGEGGDAIWLASLGWRVTGVDFAQAAIDRARVAARAKGLDVTWVVADLTEWAPHHRADLVTVSFVHEPEHIRAAVWRAAARAVADPGTLLVTGHAPDVDGAPGPPTDTRFTVDEVLAVLGEPWRAEVREVRRVGTGHHAGHAVTDVVMSLTR